MITIDRLTKNYPDGKGIHNLSFQVPQGEVFGFLGPNGAGKTTTLRILMGFIRPDQGVARIKGKDTLGQRTKLKRIIGYLPGELHFFGKLSGQDLLDLLIDMHGGAPTLKHNCAILRQRFDLDTSQKISKMSKGMKQKLGLISAFMLGAEVLLLDEPTSGLDPLMQKVFIDLIREEQKKGATILMSSHQFAEIEKTCQRVGIVRDGNLLAVEEISRLKGIQYQTFDIRAENQEAASFLRESQLPIASQKGLWFKVAISGDLSLLWEVLSQTRISEFHQRALELEDAFLQYYR
ncbi:MAG: ABC transporter ATP-binding protein [Peptococcaceae bacterium]|jgi:ABC-2 type transport system ATP-binding protein|nr:ABC transporter ATP-binding protein [Peptococcaceae bacterium]MDR2737284.1 ABC transporter ATP-binding protein [Gracilibacteraceae bacterium]